MPTTHLHRFSPVLRFLTRNAIAVIASVIVQAFALYGSRWVGPAVRFELVMLVSCVVAAIIARRLDAQPVMLVNMGMAAWRLSVVFVGTVYGVRFAPPEAQFLGMVSAVTGAVLAVAFVRWNALGPRQLSRATDHLIDFASQLRDRLRNRELRRERLPHVNATRTTAV
jgi:hypothetical protein